MTIAEQLLRLAVWRWYWGGLDLEHEPRCEDDLRSMSDYALRHWWRRLCYLRGWS